MIGFESFSNNFRFTNLCECDCRWLGGQKIQVIYDIFLHKKRKFYDRNSVAKRILVLTVLFKFTISSIDKCLINSFQFTLTDFGQRIHRLKILVKIILSLFKTGQTSNQRP